MMIVLLKTFVCLLAVYGAILLIAGIVDSISKRLKIENTGVSFLLMVKNQEDTIEGIVRSIFASGILRNAMIGSRIAVLDMGSDDETLDILMKLKNDYGYMVLYEEFEKEEIFRDFEERSKSGM